MNTAEVIESFRWELRNLQWEGEVLGQSPEVTRRTVADRRSREIVCFNVGNGDSDRLISEEMRLARDLDLALEWKVFSFDPPRFASQLRSNGFSIGESEVMVVYDLADGLDTFGKVSTDAVHQIVSVDMLRDYKLAFEAAFDRGDSGTVAQLAKAIQSGRRGLDAYLAYSDGAPASVGRVYTNPQSAFAGLYGGGTSPRYRSRGLYRAIVAARAKRALAAGARYLLVDAMPTSLPILLRLGFVRVAETWPCTVNLTR